MPQKQKRMRMILKMLGDRSLQIIATKMDMWSVEQILQYYKIPIKRCGPACISQIGKWVKKQWSRTHPEKQPRQRCTEHKGIQYDVCIYPIYWIKTDIFQNNLKQFYRAKNKKQATLFDYFTKSP